MRNLFDSIRDVSSSLNLPLAVVLLVLPACVIIVAVARVVVAWAER